MDTSLILFSLVLLLSILSASFRLLSKRVSSSAMSMRLANGVPEGDVIYSDLDRPASSLYSRSLAISGKPDYIVRERDAGLIPVEIKSGHARAPYRGHILQLAAYCLLVEENYKRPIRYGVIVYSDGVQHKIRFDRALRSDLLMTLEEMRSVLESGCPKRDHNQIQKCRSCSFGWICESSLA